MFADDTSLFYLHKDINPLFLKVNKKLHTINQWFISNNLSKKNKQKNKLFVYQKINYLLFQKRSKQDDIPFLLSKLKINKFEIKRADISR